jgi:hypothetical protein
MSHTTPAQSGPKDKPDKSRPDPPWWRSPRSQTLAALAIALIATALAIAAWFHPTHEGAAGTYPQSGDAKTNLCSAYTVVRKGVVANTHLPNPRGNDPTGHLAVAAHARLALLGGGAYLHDRLAANPGSPADLAQAVNAMANTIEQLGVNYLAGVADAVQDPLRKDLNSEIAQLTKLCT